MGADSEGESRTIGTSPFLDHSGFFPGPFLNSLVGIGAGDLSLKREFGPLPDRPYSKVSVFSWPRSLDSNIIRWLKFINSSTKMAIAATTITRLSVRIFFIAGQIPHRNLFFRLQLLYHYRFTRRKQKPPHWGGGLCRRRDLNPHEPKAHYALNVARLPVPPLRRRNLFYPKTSYCQPFSWI